MKYEPPKFKSLKDMAFIDVSRLTESEALSMLENLRWPSGKACPHCGSLSVSEIESQARSVRDGLTRCHDCKQHFTVMVGTVMEDSHITYRQWLQAFYLMCSSKKGISALQLQRNLGLGSYRSAWHLNHRIRLAMQKDPIASKLKGIVECDECYVGGKPRKGTGIENKRGRGTKKAPVMLMVERKGKAVSRPIANISAKTLKDAIKETVNKNSTIMTDELLSYNGIGESFEGGHRVVNHGKGQYANGLTNTNTAESYFALLKRGVHGTFHHISRKHLSRYCSEFSYRWNTRETNDGERTAKAIKGFEGKRLMLKELMG